MVTTSQCAKVANGLPAPKEISPSELISLIEGIAKQRKVALSYYPHAKNAARKFELIELVLYDLKGCKAMLNDRQIISTCLRQQTALLHIAPRTTIKIYQNYCSMITGMMNACRSFLGRQNQISPTINH